MERLKDICCGCARVRTPLSRCIRSSLRMLFRMFFHIRFRPRCCLQRGTAIVSQNSGQASVEAAFMLPVLFFLMLLLMQPIIILYTKTMMASAAQETCRVVSTDFDASFDDCRQFAKRRLRAIPSLSLFHVGGDDSWDIQITRSKNKSVVEISSHAKALPLVGMSAWGVAGMDDEGIILKVKAAQSTQPSWVKGGYRDWQKIWTKKS